MTDTDPWNESSEDATHDAVLRVVDTTDRLGKKIVGWRWEDGRPTISQDEHSEADKLVEQAERELDLGELAHGTVVARIWMDGESVETVEWR